MRLPVVLFIILSSATLAWSQPTTRPAKAEPPNPDQMLKQLLSPTQRPRPLEPIEIKPEITDPGRTPPAPKIDTTNLIREGEYIRDKLGRMTKTPDNQWQFTFESDGLTLKDPPIGLLFNSKLAQMETALRNTSRDLRFKVTGMVTEYNGKNFLLVEKAVVVQEVSPGILPPKKENQ